MGSAYRLHDFSDAGRPPGAVGLLGDVADAATFGALHLDYGAREVYLDGAPVELTKIEFDMLEVLSRAPRVVISRSQLVESVWEGAWYGDDHMIDVHIGNLRRKLGETGRVQGFIKTVRGVGYKFNPRHGDGNAHAGQLSLLDMTAPQQAPGPQAPGGGSRGAVDGHVAGAAHIEVEQVEVEQVEVEQVEVEQVEVEQVAVEQVEVDCWPQAGRADGAVEVVFAPDLQLIAVSQGTELLGWNLEALLGKTFAPVRLAEASTDLAQMRRVVTAMHLGGVQEWRSRVPAVWRDGRPTALLVYSRAVLAADGTLLAVRTILREAPPEVPTEAVGVPLPPAEVALAAAEESSPAALAASSAARRPARAARGASTAVARSNSRNTGATPGRALNSA